MKIVKRSFVFEKRGLAFPTFRFDAWNKCFEEIVQEMLRAIGVGMNRETVAETTEEIVGETGYYPGDMTMMKRCWLFSKR